MRLPSWAVAAAASALVVIACSSDGGAGGSSSGDGGSSSGSNASGSGGSSGTPGEGGANEWVTTTTLTKEHEGSTRTYILSVPTDYDEGKAYPLYVWLHGNPGTAESAASFAVHNVTKNEAIVAYPGAISSGGWDHGATLADNVDSSFILAMIDEIAGKYSIDTGRVLLSGWSGGGFMASAMACRYSAKFRAIGVHAGGAPYDANSPNTVPDCAGATVATFVTHGKADGTVTFDGGEYAGQYWSEHNGCSGTKSASTPAPCEAYDGCNAATPVKVCFIEGLGHPLWDQTLAVEWAWFKALP